MAVLKIMVIKSGRDLKSANLPVAGFAIAQRRLCGASRARGAVDVVRNP